MTGLILIIIVSLLASAFFSGIEIAFVASDKLRIELDRTNYILNSGFFSRFVEKPGLFSATMLVGNILTLVVYSFVFSWISAYLFAGISALIFQIIICSFLSTIFFIFIAYLLPKAIFNINPNKLLNTLSFPVILLFYLLYPLTWMCMTALQFFSVKWFHFSVGPEERKKIFRKVNFDVSPYKVENTKGEIYHEFDSEIKLFKNALDFSKVRVRDCMIQRPDMEIMEESATIEQLRQKFIETGFSKIMIYKNDIDNITGYVHSFDLFNNPQNISSCLRKISFVPETMEAKKVLSILLKEHKSLAIVVDEFGGTAGIITTEDILEEIFGEIEDEHDKPDITSKKIGENRFIFSGRMEIESINEMYNLNLQEDNSYETIAGYILYHHSSFPKSNSILQIGRFEFRILRSTKTSIELVEMRVLEK